jgi:hypothetical protein
MNQKITEGQLRAVCRELLRGGQGVSGRQMRAELKARFGVAGKTARVFRIWREEEDAARARPAPPVVRASTSARYAESELQQRLATAEEEARMSRERAELAEFRERAHQDHWALEVDRLREKLREQVRDAAENRGLKEQLMRVTADLARARRAGGS